MLNVFGFPAPASNSTLIEKRGYTYYLQLLDGDYEE